MKFNFNFSDSVSTTELPGRVLPQKTAVTLTERVGNCLVSHLYELLADFTDDPDPEPQHCRDDDPLSVKQYVL